MERERERERDLERGEDVCEGLSVRVMEVDGELLHGDFLCKAMQHLCSRTRRSAADGVTQGNLVTSQIQQLE